MRFSIASSILVSLFSASAAAPVEAATALLQERRHLLEERLTSAVQDAKYSTFVKHDVPADSFNSRSLQASAECTAARQALADNADLTAAEDALLDALSNQIDQQCTVPDDLAVGDNIVCIVDENDLVADTAAHETVCTAAGGAVYEVDFSIGCVISNGNDYIRMEIGFVNGDFCESTECSASVIANDAGELAAVLNDLEAELETLGGNGVTVDCDTTITIRDSTGVEIYQEGTLPSGAAGGSVAAILGAVLAMAFVAVMA